VLEISFTLFNETPLSFQVDCCGYPLSIFFIVVNEFCERFSYYGMRAVLVLYFRYFLRWDDDLATTIYHTFVALCYLTPILGAIVADSWLGKFKTIVYLSIVYTIGQVVMAVGAIHDITDTNQDGTPDNMTFHVSVCLFLCLFLSSTAQECGINSQQKCYPLAFGVPAALMAVALIVFIAGSSMYTKAAPKHNVMLQVCKCIGFAIKNRFKHRSSAYPKREHWMDWANEKYDVFRLCSHISLSHTSKLLIAQVKMVLKVLFLYIPLPMFWALFDQQVRTYPLYTTPNTHTGGGFVVQPDQMQTVNPILILVMVPIVDSVVYPLIKKCGLNFTPLKRMTVGMFLAGLAFVAAALVQIQIDDTLPKFPSHSEAQVKFLNMENNPLSVSVDGTPFDIQAFQSSGNYLNLNTETATVAMNGSEFMLSLIKGRRQTVLLDSTGILESVNIDESAYCLSGCRFVNGFGTVLNVTGAKDLGAITPKNFSDYGLVPQGKATFTILNGEGQTCNYSITLGFGSSYTLIIPSIFSFGPDCWTTIQQVEDIKPNTIHMAWQIPQYFLMTVGEVVFSVTGLEFSYSQAPSNMKSVLQAGWLFTVAVGNIIVLIVAEAGQLPEQWAEYVLFASLLVCVCIIFSIMAYFYTYIDPAEIEAKFTEQNPEDKEEKKKGLELGNMSSLAAEKPEQTKQTKI
uniref:Solute carrier family 15 member 1b n=1 Tax=Pygocentrus nattereri TaxID=42514 RepID=A0AAR2LJD1_PYGNA